MRYEKKYNLMQTVTLLLILITQGYGKSSFALEKSESNLEHTFTKTLFNFHRINYKPDKILFYNIKHNKNCEFHSNPLDPHYYRPQKNQKIPLKESSYFIPKGLESLGPNHIRFSFEALYKLLGDDAYIDAYMLAKTKNSNQSKCKHLAVVKVGGVDYKLETIFAKMKLVLGKPMGLRHAYALMRAAVESPDSKNRFIISNEILNLCLYGSCR